jgi:hypothetical protein
MSQKGFIPKMQIIVSRIADDATRPMRFQWSVTMMAPDATGERSLGYRGAGVIEQNLTGLRFERGPEVHDENLPRWTPMNATDRPDIRKRINNLAIFAAKKLVESGEDKFEHTI